MAEWIPEPDPYIHMSRASERIQGLPAAADTAHPNHRGRDHRMIFRVVKKEGARVLREHLLVLRPTQYTRTPEARLTVHATAGGYHADIPASDARGIVHYQIAGTTGVWPTRPWPTGPDGKQDPAEAPDGMAAIHDLRDLFESFLKATVLGRPRSEVRLELINPDEPIHRDDPVGDAAYVVVPEQSAVQTLRSAQRPSTWAYTIRLAAIARVEDFKRSQKDVEAKKRNELQRLLDLVAQLNSFSFDQMFFRYRRLIGPALQVKAALSDLRRFLVGWQRGIDTFVAYHVALVESLISDLAGIGQAVAGILQQDEGVSVEPAPGRPGPGGVDVDHLATMRRSLTRLHNSLLASPGVFAPALAGESGSLGPRTGRVALLLPSEVANGPARQRPVDRQDGRRHEASASRELASGLVIVGVGDTLDDLIPAGFTDLDVLRLNPDLDYPFVDGSRPRRGNEPGPGDGVPWVARAGDRIRVPEVEGDLGVVAGTQAASAEDEHLFGRDLFVNPATRALELDPTTGDLRIVAGIDNLLQGLRHLLRLPLGALTYAPDVGSYLAAETQGAWGGDLHARLAAIAARRTLTQDPRIRAVRRVQVRTYDGVTDLSFEADATSGRPLGRLAVAA